MNSLSQIVCFSPFFWLEGQEKFGNIGVMPFLSSSLQVLK